MSVFALVLLDLINVLTMEVAAWTEIKRQMQETI